MKQPVIFCDFDGTITENDNIVAIMRHCDPPGWKEIVQGIIDGTITIRHGVGSLFGLLPTAKKEEIILYSIENAIIRRGFAELLEYCRAQNIEFLVTSGGIDFFVYPLLAPYPIPTDRIFCNGSDFSGERIRIVWPHPCDDTCGKDCGMCKTTIIRSYPREACYRILIGDSVTDFEGAKLADLIFARSHLADKCRELGLPFYPYETFHDVIAQLRDAPWK